MSPEEQDEMNKEIIRRVLAHDESIKAEEEAALRHDATMESLQSMTSLPEAEIRRIAEEVRRGYVQSVRRTPFAKPSLAIVAVVVLVAVVATLFYSSDSESPAPTVQLPASDRALPAALRVATIQMTRTVKQPVIAHDGKLVIDLYTQFAYVNEGFPMGLSSGQTTASRLSATSLEALKTEPHYRTAQPLYGYLTLGNGVDPQFSFAVDTFDDASWRVYLDKNNNEDLTDDGPPLTNQGSGKFAADVTLTIEITSADSDVVAVPYKLWFWISASTGGQVVRFYAKSYYRGRVIINDKPYHAVIFENRDHDGLFRDSGVWIDINGDQKLDKASEHFLDGEQLAIDGELYQIVLKHL